MNTQNKTELTERKPNLAYVGKKQSGLEWQKYPVVYPGNDVMWFGNRESAERAVREYNRGIKRGHAADKPAPFNEQVKSMFGLDADKPAHTLGPWKYEFGAVWSADNGKCVAVRDSDAKLPPTEKDANMRLIAAAPELLAALQRIVNTWNAEDQRPSPSVTMALYIREARAAVAKVEGNQ